MRQHLTVKGPIEVDEVRRWLARPLARLRRKLARFPDDAVHLRIMVRETEGKELAEASIALSLPSNTLAACEDAERARAAVKEAFGEVERLLQKEKARLRRADTWRRSREAFQRELVDRVARQSELEVYGDASGTLSESIEAIEQFVARELLWMEHIGDLAPREVDTRDVVDAALERALARTGSIPPRQELLRHATAALRSETARARRDRQILHLEDDVPEVAPARAVSTLGSEALDFFQPDEDSPLLRDLLADLGATPEEIESGSEVTDALRRAVVALPASWRQALHLSQVEELDALAITEALEIDPSALPGVLERARAFLQDRLREAGVELEAPRS